MTDLNIKGTQSAPTVISSWEDGTLELRGDSYPENSFEFFEPIVKWVEQFLEDARQPLKLELHLLYLNTSSVKTMMDIFDTLEEAHLKDRAVAVRWYYDADNERIADLAEEFKEDCTFPFEIVRKYS